MVKYNLLEYNFLYFGRLYFHISYFKGIGEEIWGLNIQ